MTQELKRTPLYECHRSAGAKLVPFAGWEMPVEYEGILAEHQTVRRHAGLFDVSHMGQIVVSGGQAEAFLRHLLPNDVSALGIGDMLYSPMLRPEGGIIDDLIVSRTDEEVYLLVVNASRIGEDWEWMERERARFPGCDAEDRSEAYAMMALQGPESEGLLQGLVEDPLASLGYFQIRAIQVAGHPVLVSRSGYTGEDGFEVLCDPGEAPALWEAILGRGAVPAGLGARDTLRLEMGYCLYGNDIDETTSPLQAGLAWTVKMKEGREFIGSEALREQKEKGGYTRLAGIVLQERGVPRHGQGVYVGEREVGHVTSGSFSPTLRKGIALAYLAPEFAKPGTGLGIESRNRRLAAEAVRLPFVPSHTKSQK